TVRMNHPADAAKYRIGYLSEDRKRLGLLMSQNVSFNTTLAAAGEQFAVKGMLRGAQMNKRTQQQVDALRIKTPSIRQATKNLSGGNQQKVVIGKWLVKGCDILIFDEPTRG